MPSSTRSGLSVNSGMPGTYEAASPARTSRIGADRPCRRATAAIAQDAASRATSTSACVADIIDIGGVKAGPGDEVGVAEEIGRVAGLVAAIRDRHPDAVISVDTWRAEVGEAVAAAGADLLNDAWGGADPELAHVAAGHGIGLVCSHAGGLE